MFCLLASGGIYTIHTLSEGRSGRDRQLGMSRIYYIKNYIFYTRRAMSVKGACFRVFKKNRGTPTEKQDDTAVICMLKTALVLVLRADDVPGILHILLPADEVPCPLIRYHWVIYRLYNTAISGRRLYRARYIVAGPS